MRLRQVTANNSLSLRGAEGDEAISKKRLLRRVYTERSERARNDSYFVCIILSFVFFVFLAGNVFAESQGKIGYIDLSRSFDEYQKTKDFDRELEKKGDVKQEEREKLVQEIRKMREELELMNKNAREKKETDIEARIKSLQEFDQEAKTDLTKERDNMVKDILKEMSDVIKEYGEKNGYSVILNDRVLLYGDSTMDITNEIIKILNERYNKK